MASGKVPAKGYTSKRKMTEPLKAELKQVNFYGIKKAGERKAAAASRDATTAARVASAQKKKAQASSKFYKKNTPKKTGPGSMAAKFK